jgi:hypothetical protein
VQIPGAAFGWVARELGVGVDLGLGDLVEFLQEFCPGIPGCYFTSIYSDRAKLPYFYIEETKKNCAVFAL